MVSIDPQQHGHLFSRSRSPDLDSSMIMLVTTVSTVSTRYLASPVPGYPWRPAYQLRVNTPTSLLDQLEAGDQLIDGLGRRPWLVKHRFESIRDTAHGTLQIGMRGNQSSVTAFNNSWLNSSIIIRAVPRCKRSGGGTTPTR
ncbi:hypothetical protein EMPG_17798 [Blastomyces silverae]|uniref:Uncharacterized protein n=1 Tax=Blastomyces silverae TaxID=2060906 RepID=A0A0H1B6T5_9EURO|nr:hypothetical protein EMPG_17798 [Blastomyces silverae]